jgi:hypothetical protein
MSVSDIWLSEADLHDPTITADSRPFRMSLGEDTLLETGPSFTVNWSTSAFRRNPVYFYVSHDPELVRALQQVAAADLRWQRVSVANADSMSLVLGPDAGAAHR